MAYQNGPDTTILSQALAESDRERRLLEAVVEFYADEANWTPRVQTDLDGDACVESRVALAGSHVVARNALDALATLHPNREPGAPR